MDERRRNQETRRPRRRRPQGAPPPRKRRRRTMSISSMVVIAMFFAFVVVYMALQARAFFSPNVEFMTLRLNTMAMQHSIPGMIIREETVFQADRNGRVVFNVNEFDRVTENTLVASIRDIEAIEQNDLDREILQQELMGVADMRHAGFTDPQVERVNANLANRMDRSAHHHMQKNLADIYDLLDTLTGITENRNNMIIDEVAHLHSGFNHQYEQLAIRREQSLSDIYATHSGIMSPIIDGFETMFTPMNRRELSREQVRMSVDHEAIIPGREVEAGDDVFKIVGNTWYVSAWMPNEMVHGFTQGTNRVIYLENTATGRFEPITMRIDYMSQHTHDTFIVFRSTRYVIDFLHQRNVNIRVADNVQSGFMIPASAIATRRFLRVPLTHLHGDETPFVMHRRDDGIQPLLVRVYETTESHAYILEDTLQLFPGDALSPVNAEDLLHILSEVDIRISRGVYVTTLGYANFREISIEGEMPDENRPILLDPARNPNVRQFDSIVIDAGMVRQGQVLR